MATPSLFPRARLASAHPAPLLRGRAFALIAIATMLAQMGALIAFNVLVNPRSEFPVDLVEPLVQDERHQKTLEYSRLDPAPEAIILGSSRAWGLPPDALEELGYAGAYNFAFGGGTTEDAKRAYEFALRNGPAPRALYYAFEDWQLDGYYAPATWREAKEPTLADAAEYAPRAIRSLSLTYVRDSWRALDAHMHGAGLRHWVFQENGTAQWERFEAAKANGTWTFDEAASVFLGGALTHYAPGVTPDAGREAALAALVAEARARGTRVVLLLPPMHPDAVPLFPAEGYARGVAHARAVVLSQCGEGVQVYDLTDPATYGSTLDGFVDGWHYSTGEGRLIIEHISRSPDLCAAGEEGQTV